VIVSDDPDVAIVISKPLVALDAALSLTCAVKLNVPFAVGVPAIVPLVELKDNPCGRLPAMTVQFE
jgi:hypothetical protein